MCTAKAMAEIYEANRATCKYVHSTSRGHEAIQLATAFQLLPCDYVSPYYRDESMLLGLGFTPYEMMLQLLAKGNDIFTGGREYYSHPNYKGEDKPNIIHQSSATGMQAIPTTGVAQGIKYLERIRNNEQGTRDIEQGIGNNSNEPTFNLQPATFNRPVVICSLGDASVTEGEVSEAFQFAALHQLPIIYLVQDNNWGISVTSDEARTTNASEMVKGLKGISRISIDGSDFLQSYEVMKNVVEEVRRERHPFLVHAKVPLLGHHTSGVRKEFYRTEEDLAKHYTDDPGPKMRKKIIDLGIAEEELIIIENETASLVAEDFKNAVAAPEPDPSTVSDFVFVPTTVTQEKGERTPVGKEKIMMVDAGLFAIREIMEQYPEALLYGQDVGRRLGGVFREAATLANNLAITGYSILLYRKPILLAVPWAWLQ
jgi:2-oxoisovalerate dehydrogenase E1 component